MAKVTSSFCDADELRDESLRATHSDSLSVRLIRGVLAGVLSDESFAIATDEMKTSLRITQELIKYFHQPSIKSERFASWLVNVLDEVVTKSKKRCGMINQDKFWNKYHQLTISQLFNEKWLDFWGTVKLIKSPCFTNM